MRATAWRGALGLGALCCIAPAQGAISLGDLEVRSAPGAPLEARIAVRTADREPLRGSCFSLAPRGTASLPGPTLELRRSAHGASLFVRTRGPVAEGAAFAIAVACPGAASAPATEYSVRFATPLAATRAIATGAAPPLPVVTNLEVREGDTLASLAEVFFPRDRVARARYVEVIRAENATLAAVGDEQPLVAGATIALPDLHAFAETVPAQSAPAAGTRASPRVAHAPTQARVPKAAHKVAAAAPARDGSPRASSPHRAEAREGADAGFRLRLSAPVMDLAPSRGMDDRKRAALRERLLVLEGDDRTAAMLAMRDRIRRLESQVSELQLKLAAMPAAVAPRILPAAPATPRPTAQPVAPPPPKSDSQKIEAPKIEAPAPKVEASKTEAPQVSSAAPEGAAGAHRKPVVVPRAPGEEPWYSDVLWWLRLLLIPLAGVLGVRYFARRRSTGTDEYYEDDIAPDLAVTEPGAQARGTEPRADAEVGEAPLQEAATRVPAEDNLELRRRYIEERFPEIANGAVVLDDARSMVKAARLLYDDGAIARAIELLQFAIEQDADAMPAWLALFAIFRLQGLSGEFAELARRFAERHGASDEWSDVRAIGRTLDPGNPLYEGEEVVAAMHGGPEGWLRGPGDAPASPLAGELRSRLMAEASITDADLAADPVPALRKAEVFSVA